MHADSPSPSSSADQGLEYAGGAAGRGSNAPVETSGQATTSREPAAIPPGHRTAACESCRAGKLKCIKLSPTAEACSRCARFNLECVFVPFRLGRKKGARNKSALGPHQHQHQRRSNDSSENMTAWSLSADALSTADLSAMEDAELQKLLANIKAAVASRLQNPATSSVKDHSSRDVSMTEGLPAQGNVLSVTANNGPPSPYTNASQSSAFGNAQASIEQALPPSAKPLQLQQQPQSQSQSGPLQQTESQPQVQTQSQTVLQSCSLPSPLNLPGLPNLYPQDSSRTAIVVPGPGSAALERPFFSSPNVFVPPLPALGYTSSSSMATPSTSGLSNVASDERTVTAITNANHAVSSPKTFQSTSHLSELIKEASEPDAHPGAENPLLMLAAQIEEIPAGRQSATQSADSLGTSSYWMPIPAQMGHVGFPCAKLDVEDRFDPVSLGLVDESSLPDRFEEFFNLEPLSWHLDRQLHTPTYVRSRSALLLSTILWFSARVRPEAAALSIRLEKHISYLVKEIMSGQYRSSDLVTALATLATYLPASDVPNLDATTTYIALALNMGLDLELYKFTHSSAITVFGLPSSAYISGERALKQDGHPSINPASPRGIRLIRNRQRAWLSTYLVDSGVSISRARAMCVPLTPAVQLIDTWCTLDGTIPTDHMMAAVAVLRRETSATLERIRALTQQSSSISFSLNMATRIVDECLQRWESQFSYLFLSAGHPFLRTNREQASLCIYSALINDKTGDQFLGKSLVFNAVLAALRLMNVVCEDGGSTAIMSNTSALMCCFGVALTLSVLSRFGREQTTAELDTCRKTVATLVKSGLSPPHKRGFSAAIARRLQSYFQETEAVSNTHSLAHIPHQAAQPPLSTFSGLSGIDAFLGTPWEGDQWTMSNSPQGYDLMKMSVSEIDKFVEDLRFAAAGM